MKLSSFLFGSSLPVKVLDWGIDRSSVTLIPSQDLCTPCGTLRFPAGQRVFFEKVTVHGDIIRPESGGLIKQVV